MVQFYERLFHGVGGYLVFVWAWTLSHWVAVVIALIVLIIACVIFARND